MNVLSLFDGMSCGRIALDRVGIPVTNYYASEIDKYAIKVSEANYPDIIRLGDVTNWHEWELDWSSIDLILAGSPCQGFSFAGKQLAFDDPRSALFFVFVDILNHVKSLNPKVKFLLENVKMKKEYMAVISERVGVEPVFINSALVSAQNRQRYYWANWDFQPPEDKGIFWGDVREHGVEWSSMYYSDAAMDWIGREGTRKGKPLKIHSDDEKMQMVEASHFKKYSSQRFFGVIDVPATIAGKRLNAEWRYPDVFNQLEEGKRYRYITPLECERLQTVPDNYTAAVSNTQRYKMLGNGWTVDVIAHILKSGFLKEDI